MKKVLSLIVTVILLSSYCLTVMATSRSELQGSLSDIQSQIDEAATELKGVKTDKSKTLRAVEDLEDQISAYEAEVDKLNGDITNIQSNISQQEQSLVEVEASFAKQEKLFKQRVVAQYKAGDTSYLDVLMGSGDLSDFISNYHMVSKVTEYDEKMLDSIEKEKIKIQTLKAELDKQKSDLEATKKNKQSTVNALSNSKTVKTKHISELSDKEKELQEELEQFEKDKKALENEIKKLTSSSNPTYAGGVMAWPVPGYYKISCGYFGYANHTGVDITGNTSGAVTNAPAVAANDGKVIISEDLFNSKGGYRSYGRYVVIDHGGGVTTLYAHLNSRSVTVGQQVTKGQTIGLVGSTGNSSGPHLHFEVRINGSATNPMNYIT